jgi:Predicted membrane protein (DUF2142)
MPDAESPRLESQERKWVLLLSCLAAIHVFLFSTLFPLDNNVDEGAHFDLVLKYSHGQPPRGMEPYSAEALQYLAVFASQEYLYAPSHFPDGRFPPPLWMQPPKQAMPILLARELKWQGANHESSQPPLYYALAGLWWHLGKLCGLDGGPLIYWLRFLNVLLVPILLCVGYAAARLVFPGNPFIRLGVPALLAFLPQTAFYSINNDVLSPLCFGAAFIGLVKWWRAEIPGARLGAFTGLALAATALTKMTSIPLIGVAVIAALFKTWRLAKDKKIGPALPSLILLALCAALPMAAWMAWCKICFGDFTGSAAKAHLLGWTLKPFAEWWQHPIFTPQGLWTYLVGQLATFWQGEFWWHNVPLAWPKADAAYTLASLLLLALAVAGLFQRSAGTTPAQHAALGFAFAGFAAELASFALASVIYDFHNCPNPSREHPYFEAGRMMLGALVPFLLVFVFGLDRLLGRFGNRTKFIALAAMIAAMLILEILTDWPAFSSQYNWFHM